jgi:hypothetical protein
MWEKDRPLVILLFFVIGLFPMSAYAEGEKTAEAGRSFTPPCLERRSMFPRAIAAV